MEANKLSTCNKQGCGAAITWAKSAQGGKFLAVDVDDEGNPTDRDGKANLVPTGEHDDKGTPIVRNVKAGEGEWSCHWSTCPVPRPKKAASNG